VKSWFETNQELLQPKPGSANAREFSKDLILPFFEKEPDWEDFYSYQFPDGRQVFEVHLKNLTGIMPTTFMEKYGSQADDLTEESLLFVENPQVADGFVPVVVRYFSEGQKSEGMTYHQIPLGWTGMIDLFTYDERHLRSIKVENGQLISHIRYQTEEPKVSSRDYSSLIVCSGYWVDFPVYGIFMGVGSSAPVYILECTSIPDGGGGSSIPVNPPTGGGGSSPTNPPPPTGNNGETDESNNFCRDNHCIPFPEEEIIKTQSFIGTKADCVYERLLDLSGGFRKAIQKFDGSFPVAHLKFDMGNIEPSRGMAIPPNSTGTINSPDYVITIRLNNTNSVNGVTKRPNLLVAKTIAHEVIHAEMFRKLLSVLDNGGNIDGVTRQNVLDALDGNYPGLYDYYRRHKNWQHAQMATHYRETLAKILQEYDTGIAVPNNQQPSQLYMDLAWEGLIYGFYP